MANLKTIMKTKIQGLLLMLSCLAGSHQAAAQGTAFTYQGLLNSGTNPVTGLYDFEFSLSNAPSGGSQVGSTVTQLAVGVTNGLFGTLLDFGPVLTGSPAWLAISVRSNGVGSYAALSPLQQLTPAPYAILAESAMVVPGLAVQANASSGAPNLIGGSPYNFAAAGVVGGTIGGGGATNYVQGPHHYQYTNSVTGSFGTVGGGEQNTAGTGATVGGGQQNSASGQLSSVGGGLGNFAIGFYATVAGGAGNVASNNSTGAVAVGGGFNNFASGADSTVGGGFSNQATNSFATVSGGSINVAGGQSAAVSGGSGNQATNSFSTVPGGANNLAGGQYSFAAGYSAQATNDGAFVWADDSQSGPFGSTTSNQFSVRAFGGVRFVTGGAGLMVDGLAVLVNGAPGALGNTGLGSGTLNSITGSNNTASGFDALDLSTTGNNNTGNGAYALGGAAATGGGNTGSGAYALYDFTSGYNNTALGFQALYSNTTGFDNVGIGVDAFQVNAAGHQNTAAGTYAFQKMTAGNGNIGLGYNAGSSLVAGTNNIYIGNPGSAADNGVIRIGNGQTNTIIAGTTVGINMSNPTAALDVNGEYMVVEGLGGVRCYIGDDGYGNDVQVGSVSHGVTSVSFYNATDNTNMQITCSAVTITGGSDVAEPFDVSSPSGGVLPGSVVVIDEESPGHLKESSQAYDTRVAGVLSGANGIHPGIQMQQQGLLEGGRNVALTGRVYVRADTANGAIKPGDLLTTSDTPGHAMRVSDHAKAQGAILGKAMSGLTQGRGMVLVLVTLQ